MAMAAATPGEQRKRHTKLNLGYQVKLNGVFNEVVEVQTFKNKVGGPLPSLHHAKYKIDLSSCDST